MRNRLSVDEYYQGILDQNRIILSKAITLIESNRAEDKFLAQSLIEKILPHSGKSKRIGITGVPGVGKSTFIESFGKLLIQKGNKVAVLAIDPSSQKTRGSIMGDKTRMDSLSVNKQAYIRPSASGSSLGGVANKTRETILLCEAAGFDIVLVETVGVGQSEVAVKNMTDFFLLLMLAGAGDELQGVKKGIMEMTDMVAITKADGDNITNSRMAKVEYENALHLFQANKNGWFPKVNICSAMDNTGMDDIWDSVAKYYTMMLENGFIEENRIDQNKHWLHQLLDEKLKADFFSNENVNLKLKDIESKLTSGAVSLNKEVEELFRVYKG